MEIENDVVVNEFVSKFCVFEPTAMVPKSVLFKQLRCWCGETNQFSILCHKKIKLTQYLKNRFPDLKDGRGSKNQSTWLGMGLKKLEEGQSI